MSEDEPNYAAYISYHTMASNTYSLFMGFTFTSIVVLLTWLPDPTQLRIQVVLFSLALVFHILGFLLFVVEAVLAYCVRIAPTLPKGYRGRLITRLSDFVWYALTGITVLMFVIWNLVFLAIASAAVAGFFFVFAKVQVKPFYRAVTDKWVRK